MPSFGKLLDKFDIEKEILETNERVYAQIGAIQDSVSKGQEKANEAFDLFNRRSESSDLDLNYLNERMDFLKSMKENITRLKKHMDSIDQMKEDLEKVIAYKKSPNYRVAPIRPVWTYRVDDWMASMARRVRRVRLHSHSIRGF